MILTLEDINNSTAPQRFAWLGVAGGAQRERQDGSRPLGGGAEGQRSTSVSMVQKPMCVCGCCTQAMSVCSGNQAHRAISPHHLTSGICGSLLTSLPVLIATQPRLARPRAW
ncbi:hypothetical protein DPEC_G00370750 [Dallia pectoralis]|nr:hypothetical protein DPEC_G00370750 [Dallia pectoralis]